MKINNLPGSPLFSAKEYMTQRYQKKENKPINKVVEMINNKMKDESALLEISNKSIQKLKVRNLLKLKGFEGKISDNLKAIEEKYETLTGLKDKLDLITELVEKYNKLIGSEGLATSGSRGSAEDEQISEGSRFWEGFSEERKTITESINELSDLIEEVEKMKAQREGKEYKAEGSIAEKFRNFRMGDISISKDILKEAKDLVEAEIRELYEEIEKMKKLIDEIMESQKKEISSEKENISSQIKFLRNMVDNL